MRNEFDKCYFCTEYDEYDGCGWGCFCENRKGFRPDYNKIIQKAKDKNLSVTDVIALVNI